jgi:predicted TPR repeat methyltransferase
MWKLDELAHAGAEHLDPGYIAAFDEKSPPNWSDDIAALQAFGIEAISTVVDFGAGTGSFAEALGPHVARVVGVDISEAMVAAMRARRGGRAGGLPQLRTRG